MTATFGFNSHALKNELSSCYTLLSTYKWLTDSFVLDFFTEKHWEKLPPAWADVLDVLSLEEIGKWIQSPNEELNTKIVLPLSLTALKASAKSLALNRISLPNLDNILNYLTQLGFDCTSQQDCKWSCPWSANNQSGTLGNLSKIFHKHVKPKKQHELYRLSHCCAVVSRLINCETVVDIGAGVGHLSRFLSYGYGLDLICLECQEKLGEAAIKLDSQLEEACKRLNIVEFSTPRHITVRLSPDTNNLKEIIDSHTVKTPAVGLIGLHTCGDLGPTLIRNFTIEPEIKFILAIGCCYMKMNCDRSSPVRGYPMSNFVQNELQSSFVSYEALEVACHALESYCDRLAEMDTEKLKVHCYRATLETLLVRLEPPLRRAGLRSVKNAHLMSFEDYAQKAVDKMNIVLNQDDLTSQHVQSCMEQWKRVVVFYSLRLLLAPVIETVIQLDRLLYLSEQGLFGCLLPLFDCRLSPRNYALLCVKPEQLKKDC